MQHVSNLKGHHQAKLLVTKYNKACNVSKTYHWDAFVQQLLQWKSNVYYIAWFCVFVALGIQQQCSCAILPSVSCSALQYFSTFCHKRYGFRKTVTEHKICVLIFSTTFVWNIFHSKKKWARYDKKCILVFMQSTHYSCQILMKLEFSRQNFEKSSTIKFHENPSSGSRDGRTDE